MSYPGRRVSSTPRPFDSITDASGILDRPVKPDDNTGCGSAISRRDAPEVCTNAVPRRKREQGMPGARCTRGLVCKSAQKETHTSIQVQRKHSGIPRAMALRLMPCSPRRRIRLVTVAAGLMALAIRLDRSRHRQLGTSNGCRDHTVLPYALAPFVLRAGIAHERLALRHRCAPTLPRPPHPYPTFVTTRDRPSCRARTGRAGSADLPDGESGILPVGLFCRSRGASGQAKARLSRTQTGRPPFPRLPLTGHAGAMSNSTRLTRGRTFAAQIYPR